MAAPSLTLPSPLFFSGTPFRPALLGYGLAAAAIEILSESLLEDHYSPQRIAASFVLGIVCGYGSGRTNKFCLETGSLNHSASGYSPSESLANTCFSSKFKPSKQKGFGPASFWERSAKRHPNLVLAQKQHYEGRTDTEELLDFLLRHLRDNRRSPELINGRLLPRCIEVGAGEGVIADLIHSRGGIPVLATDLVTPTRGPFRTKMDMAHLIGIPDGYMDSVVSVWAAEYVRNARRHPFLEFNRVLRSDGNGRLLMLVHHADSEVTIASRMALRNRELPVVMRQFDEAIVGAAYPDEATLRNELDRAGFDLISLEACYPHFVSEVNCFTNSGWLVHAVKRSQILRGSP